MTVWTRLKDLVDRVAGHDKPARNFHEDELRLASERRTLKALLREQFELDDDEVRRLVREASQEESESVDLFGFTNVLCRELDQDGRKRVVEMLWEVVMADGVIHEFESNLVWRTAELLGVSTRDRVTLRQAVAARHGIRSDL